MGFFSKLKHKSNEAASRTNAEKNKSVAKSSRAPWRTRATATGNYVDDKIQAHRHKNQAELESHKMRV
ncbi:hypothetical protein EPUS_00865 [Endocarpon pusillum Z07020]|uniref:Uncharacterized protein n=1 Tax=Endocarpon pusillum (strain Z07020 / HMAS-L-300199) TaxID=1263415 RepID=U1G848_ENDPU|nr:uncharacterized protein EPUS_00865 [Endocarpon pusillum Z07020]ERF73612.1 hypothetical protein EPUS_00865 [Endocarpon pusillum Z07020]